MTNTMPVLTDEKRKELIADLNVLLCDKDPSDQSKITLIARIALASLTTDVFQWYGSISGNTYQDKDGDPNRFPIYTAPPVPIQKAVNMPGRIANIHLRSPLEVEDMYRSFLKAAVRGAGYEVKE